MEKDAYTTFFKKRLNKLLGHLYGEIKGSVPKFAESLGTTPGHVRDWLGENRPSLPSASYLGRIYGEHKVNLNWLVPGDENEPMLKLPLEEALKTGAPGFPIVTAEHVQKAYALVKEGLGKHSLPVLSEGYIVGSIAEGVAEGRSQEYLLTKFSSLVEMAAQQKKARRPGQG